MQEQWKIKDPSEIKSIIEKNNNQHSGTPPQPRLVSYKVEEKIEITEETDFIDASIEEDFDDIFTSGVKVEEELEYENLSEDENDNKDKYGFRKIKTWYEKDMHPLLVKYLKESPYFSAYAKTIDQSASSNLKRGLNEWDHPDIVAVEAEMYLNFDNEINNFLKNTNQSYMKIYSFELKQNITLGTLRKYYFQAVSNSTWANEGYLVAMNIEDKNENDIMEELKRLHNSFGIGVIILDKDNLQKSKVLFRGKTKADLDKELINKIVTKSKNKDFTDFIQAVNQIANARNKMDINKERFDRIYSDEEMEDYIYKKKFD